LANGKYSDCMSGTSGLKFCAIVQRIAVTLM
jgi:hypothetical protein